MATLSASAAAGPHQAQVLREHGTGIASTSRSCIGLPSPNSVAAYASPSREPRDEELGPGVLLVCCFLHLAGILHRHTPQLNGPTAILPRTLLPT